MASKNQTARLLDYIRERGLIRPSDLEALDMEWMAGSAAQDAQAAMALEAQQGDEG